MARGIPTPAVPVIDRQTSLMTVDWYDFFNQAARVRASFAQPLIRQPPTGTITSWLVSIDASLSDQFTITLGDSMPVTIGAPANATNGQVINITIRNSPGAALGTITWDAVFKKPAFTSPGMNNSRSITFHYDGTNWIMRYQSANDVPN